MDRKAGRRYRVTRGGDISRLFAEGRNAGNGLLTLYALPNGLAYCRAAVAVGARHGKAAKRNRAKRLCREAFRLTRAELPPGCDYVILPSAGRTLTLENLRASIKALAGRIGAPSDREGKP